MFPADSLAGAAGTSHYSVALLSALGPIAIAALGVINHRKGKTRDAGRKSEFAQLQQLITDNHRETSSRFGTVELELRDLKGFVIGPDGENGLRGDVRELKSQVDGLVERERDRLEMKAYDRRRSGT